MKRRRYEVAERLHRGEYARLDADGRLVAAGTSPEPGALRFLIRSALAAGDVVEEQRGTGEVRRVLRVAEAPSERRARRRGGRR